MHINPHGSNANQCFELNSVPSNVPIDARPISALIVVSDSECLAMILRSEL